MKIIVIGGVAAGASAAARARRLSEEAEIILFERGKYISFANCGLPYHLSGTIRHRDNLLVMTPELYTQRTNVQVRTEQNVTGIDRENKRVKVTNHATGETYEESYDKIIIATGSSPFIPPIPGTDLPGVFQLWTIPDLDKIMEKVHSGVRRAIVVGAGFIGLEAAENLIERDVKVDVVEMLPQILPTLDQEMTQPLVKELVTRGVKVHLEKAVNKIEQKAGGLVVSMKSGEKIEADMVLMSVGVRPNSQIAKSSGLKLGERGGIYVDDTMCTSDPDIYAAGDVVEIKDAVFGGPTMVPLAGPANRQGRIAAQNILGVPSTYSGSLGTSIIKIFGLTAGSVGWTERRLKAAGKAYKKIYQHPFDHASYYPGAVRLSMKLLFDDQGKILGAQIVGEQGVDKRIDVVATAMRGNMSVYDLAELELAYSPPYNSAKDVVNFAGMIAVNVLEGRCTMVDSEALPEEAYLLDIQEAVEYELRHLEGAVSIPIGELRDRLEELPRDKLIVPYCKVGMRGYIAEQLLKNNGFRAANLNGGWYTWDMYNPQPVVAPKFPVLTPEMEVRKPLTTDLTDKTPDKSIDVTTLQCPGPIVRVKQEMEALSDGQILEVEAPQSFRPDMKAWCHNTGNTVLKCDDTKFGVNAWIMKGLADEALMEAMHAPGVIKKEDTAAIVAFSNDLDKMMAAFIMATGMAAQGTKVTMFFTFWGLSTIRKAEQASAKKDFMGTMFGMMLPRGAAKLTLSKMNMLGMGTLMMKMRMKDKGVTPLPELIGQAREMGVKFIACDMAMNMMGIARDELLDDVDEVAGVAAFAALTRESGSVLFI
ncbi:MAG: pyridine nucleotide-disulfide oxidoreductase [Spartobacteria bacterium]|nr:pyridine nucleotide-disulfide oxidoreductase [Spartobacteria bacterium]